MIFLVYFLVNNFGLLFQGGQYNLKNIYGLIFSQEIWFTFAGRAVPIREKYLVYFSVKKIWFTFPGRAVCWLNLVGLLFSALVYFLETLTSRDGSFCWFTLVYLVL